MIDSKIIIHVAKLARLKLTEQEISDYSHALNKILEAFNQLQSLDTKDVEPLITPTQIEFCWRVDEVEQNYTNEEMLAQAPDRIGHLFKVPPVV